MKTYTILIDGEESRTVFESTAEEAIEAYKNDCIEEYRDVWGEDPEADAFDWCTIEAVEQ